MELAIASEIISVAVLSARCRAVQWRFLCVVLEKELVA